MTSLDRLQESLKSVEGQKTLVEWITNPFTQLVLAAGRELSRPVRPFVTDPHTIAMSLGETVGANTLLDFLMNPAAHPAQRQRGETLQADYGARRILKDAEK